MTQEFDSNITSTASESTPHFCMRKQVTLKLEKVSSFGSCRRKLNIFAEQLKNLYYCSQHYSAQNKFCIKNKVVRSYKNSLAAYKQAVFLIVRSPIDNAKIHVSTAQY